jgi:serine protease inhibitor
MNVKKIKYLLCRTKNRSYSFCVILPKDRNGLPPTHNILDKTSAIIGKAFDKGEFQYVNLTLPKFTQEIELNIIPLLESIGVTKLFDYTMQANGMTDIDQPMTISTIRQKVKIEVNETGTKASSATDATSYTKLDIS